MSPTSNVGVFDIKNSAQMTLSPEEVGYWYFRLNGFLTIPNFVLHPDEAGNQRTDIDVLGVRFPYRAELLRDPMPDATLFTAINDMPLLVAVEIKRGRCEINRTLLDPDEKNVHRLLRAIGLFPTTAINDIADDIYKNGGYRSNSYHFTLCCLGDTINERIQGQYSLAMQIVWTDILDFIYNRFGEYRSRKHDHPQWDDAGKILWNVSAQSENTDRFAEFIKKLWDISETI